MNDVLVKNSKIFSNGPRKVKQFNWNNGKSQTIRGENLPLISADTDSDSDEEVILHDIRFLKANGVEVHRNSCLRQIKKLTSPANRELSEKVSSDPLQNCDFLELDIKEGDTLQSISIKYHCSISDIKRANNIISNQEFYARKSLKIPVNKHSLLSEILPPCNDAKPHSSTTLEINNCDHDVRTINVGIAGRCPSPQDSAAFFQKMDEDLVKIMLSTKSQKESLEAATAALTEPRIQPLVKESFIPMDSRLQPLAKKSFNPIDFRIQGNYLMILLITVVVIIPIIILVDMYLKSSHVHNIEENSSSSDVHSTQLHVRDKS